MVIADFDQYTRLQGEDGQVFIVVLEMPMHKVLCVAESDVTNGVDHLPVVLMDKPA